jgi:hypothetical protein
MLRQGTTFRHAALLTALGVVAACSHASAAAPPPKEPWATVNICDTTAYPNQMGVWASMPGNGTRQRMWMRFHAQFYDATWKKWLDVQGSGVSDWRQVGSARVKAQQRGYTFSFAQPPPGTAFMLRGAVDFQWRIKQRTRTGHIRTVVVRTLHANTKGQHPSDGADPPGYSSDTCELA